MYIFFNIYFSISKYSMDAFSNEKAKELKLLNLKRRRSKLGEMLAEERHMFEVISF